MASEIALRDIRWHNVTIIHLHMDLKPRRSKSSHRQRSNGAPLLLHAPQESATFPEEATTQGAAHAVREHGRRADLQSIPFWPNMKNT